MSRAFDHAVRQVLAREGGSKLTNDVDDRGGLTKYGISKRAFPEIDIQSLTEDQAIAIYKRHYWDVLGLDGVNAPDVAGAIFDTGVNMGVGAAAKLAQMVAGVPDDGKIGPISLAAINRSDPGRFLSLYVLARIERCCDICTRDQGQKKYLLGWIKRALDLLG